MRCIICDVRLKEHEAVRRHAMTNEFLDMCDSCLRDIPNIPTKLPNGVVIETDSFAESEGYDVQDVTDCYNLDIDKDE